MSDPLPALSGDVANAATVSTSSRASPALAVDASVAIKWYVPEPGAAEAAALLQTGQPLIAPELLVAELGNVLWKKVRAGELTADEVAEIAVGFTQACPVSLWAAGPLLPPALKIAVEFGRSVYDSIYLAVALAGGVQLVTADQRFVNALYGTPLEPKVRLLESA